MLNLGPEKLLLVFAVAFIVLGPEELPKAARQLGRWMAILRELRDRAESEVRGVAESLLSPPPDHNPPGPPQPQAATAPLPEPPPAVLD